MDHAQACAGLHRDHGLDGHRQIDDRAIACLVAERLEGIRELADTLIELLVGHLGDLAAIGLEDDRDLVGIAIDEVDVQAIGRNIQFPVAKPRVERRLRFVEHLRERLGPLQVLAREATPEAVRITVSLVEQCLVCGFARNVGLRHERLGRREYTGFVQRGLDGI